MTLAHCTLKNAYFAIIFRHFSGNGDLNFFSPKERQQVTAQNDTYVCWKRCVVSTLYQKTVIKMSLYVVRIMLQLDLSFFSRNSNKASNNLRHHLLNKLLQ